MPTINRKVIDISHYNSVTSWASVKAAGIVGVISKATQGSTYVDSTYINFKKQALDAGLLWGAYHFGDNSSISQQINNFLDVVGNDNNILYALDWEDLPGKTMSLNQARDFIATLDNIIGLNRCVLYSGNRAKEALGNTVDGFLGSHRLWLAQYGNTPICQASWSKYWLWQYSDGKVGPQPHGCPGVTGEVDTNSWNGTDQELKDQWTGLAAIPIPPVIPKVTITVEGNVQLVVNGKIII